MASRKRSRSSRKRRGSRKSAKRSSRKRSRKSAKRSKRKSSGKRRKRSGKRKPSKWQSFLKAYYKREHAKNKNYSLQQAMVDASKAYRK